MPRRFATAALLAVLSGCIGLGHNRVMGTGDVTRTQRSVGTFARIVVDGTADLHVNVGSQESLTLEAQPNIAELIRTTVSDGTLTISQKGPYFTDKAVLMTVGVPTLESLRMRGAANATIAGMHGTALELSIAGTGNVAASGSVDRLSIDCSGAGNAELSNLAVRDAVVRLSGVGYARLDASSTLDVEINGVGSVTYRGSPRIVHQVIRGIGKLSPG